jgi:hypothetical protein
MNVRKWWTLIVACGLAVASVLVLSLLLGRNAAGASADGGDAAPRVRLRAATFTISGTVINAATQPISGVVVYAWNRHVGSGSVGDTTDSGGHYRVTLGAGNYELNFTPPCGSGYASQSHKGIVGPPDQTHNVVLSSGYTVSGTVFASDGITPVGNVAIYAYNRETADGFGLPPTDNHGHFCIGLEPGTYELSFTPPPCLGLGPTTVVITINQDTNLNIILRPGFTMGGRVTNPSGGAVPGVQVYAQDPHIGGFGFAPTNEAGRYTGTLPLTGTPPTGTYDVQFLPPPGLGLGSVTVIDVVSTTAHCPNATRSITLPAGFTLSGTVRCNSARLKNVFVYAEPAGPHDPSTSLPGYGAYTVDDGSYGLPLVSGTYTVTFTPPPAAGLNAKAFTATEIVTDTVLDVNFCVCSGFWITETVDSAGNVGVSTSLAVAPTYPYTPHVSYGSIIASGDLDLKYAWRSGATWISETVDQRGGEWPSLALVQTYPYTPCISYHDQYVDWGLKYGCLGSTGWTTTMIGSGWAGKFGTSLALEPTYPYTPHISYDYPYATGQHLGHTHLSGTTWYSGTWRGEMVETGPVGAWSSLALERTSPYPPHISYQDSGNKDLKHAWFSGTTWLTETVDSAGDTGWCTSLALDAGGKPHISYFDNTNDALKYARLSGIIWFSETVDSMGKQEAWAGRGATSLELDQADMPYITYYDATHGDLKFARFDGKVWIIQTVDSGGDVGSYSSLALDPVGCPHISYYDVTHGDLKYAYIPPHYVFLPLLMRDYP